MVKKDFSDVVSEYSTPVYRFVLSKVKHREMAEDITQDVFLKAFQAWENYTELDQLKSWIFTIANNCVLQQYKYAGRRIVTYSMSHFDDDGNAEIDFPDFSSDPETAFMRKEAVEAIIEILNRLPMEHQVILKCRYIEDMSLAKTAEVTGLSIGTVKSRTYYAIREMRKMLNINETDNNNILRRKNIMTCKDAKAYLYIYAIGDLNPELKKEVDDHVKECGECREILDALKELVTKTHFPLPEENVFYNYNIEFPESNIQYSSSNPKSLYSADEHGNIVETVSFGYTDSSPTLKDKTNKAMRTDGSDYPFSLYDFLDKSDGKSYTVFSIGYTEGIEKEKNIHLARSLMLEYDYGGIYNPEGIEEGLFFRNSNRKAIKGKSVTYSALHKNAYDISVVDGSGIITAGNYRFVYTEKYTADDEAFLMRYSFRLK